MLDKFIACNQLAGNRAGTIDWAFCAIDKETKILDVVLNDTKFEGIVWEHKGEQIEPLTDWYSGHIKSENIF